MSTLLAPLAQRREPAAPALILPPSTGDLARTIPYADLLHLVRSFQAQLAGAYGLRPGDVVSSSLSNNVEFVVSFLGIGFERLTSAPLNPAYNESEVSFYLSDTKSSLLILPRGALSASPTHPAVAAAKKLNIPVAEVWVEPHGKGKVVLQPGDGKPVKRSGEVKDPREEDVALVLHTSGTTGRPKAVPLTHANLARTMQNIVNTYELTPADRTYLVMPLFHVHGLLAGLLAPLLSGGSIVLPSKFSASAFWPDFISTFCTWYTAVPTIHVMLLRSKLPSKLPTIRFIRSCSSSLSPMTFHELEKTFGAPVLEAYAMSEAAHQMTSNPLPHRGPRYPGSVGIGQGVEVKILDEQGRELPRGKEGEVCVRGPNVTKGYLNNEKANRESYTAEGFFRTGDQGRQDEKGYLWLTGRIKELINRGGEKISPLEVDSALLSVPGVGEAVSFGVPNDIYGEVVWAVVVPKSGAQIDEVGVKRAVGEKLASFKVPEKVFVVKEIPKTATGKIQRRNISAKFARQSKL